MKTLEQFIIESKIVLEGTQNTILSNINELMTGFFLSGKTWSKLGKEALALYNKRIEQALPEEVDIAIGQAKVMAQEFESWARNNGYSGKITGVWWTALPGSISKAVGYDVDQRKNPADILVQFSSGPSDGFLGLSAKATKGSGDIGFKNPGIGTIDSILNLNLADMYKHKLDDTIKQLKLPISASERKQYIRADVSIKKKTEEIGSALMSNLRDELFDRIYKMSQKELFDHILSDWMDATITTLPYVKVTGHGKKEPYLAEVVNPLDNEKLKALSLFRITPEKVGNESIGIKAGKHKIMKMRFKFESEKMASSIKMSGEPW